MISFSLLRRRGFFALPALLLLSILPAAAKDARVSGNISYRERIALPPGFVVRVELLDISRQDAPAQTLNAIELTPAHQVPIPYEIGFDKTRINPRHSYAVRAQISVERTAMVHQRANHSRHHREARRVTPISGCNAPRRRERTMLPTRMSSAQIFWANGWSRIFPGAASSTLFNPR